MAKHMKYNSDTSSWLPNQIEKRCTDEAIKYGEIYFEQLDRLLTCGIQAIEGRPVPLSEFEMFTRVEHKMKLTNDKETPVRASKNYTKKNAIFFSTFFWKDQAVIEVEFSDYFYFKPLKLKQKPSTDIIT